jgi:hypothetical protein
MARMIPQLELTDIPNTGERLVYEALQKQLPDDWVVRFHYPACWKVGGYLKDLEVDFIIIAPSKGLLFLEVKSSYGFQCESAAWYRVKKNGHEEKTRSPLDQVMGTMHRVVERVSEQIFDCKKNEFPGIYGHLVLYPKGRLIGSLPKSVSPKTVATRKNMDDLDQLIPSLFDHWGPPAQGHKFSHGNMRKVVEFFEENCRYIQVLAADMDEDESQIEELTRKQFDAFRYLLQMPRVVVSGPAGSGKTMIAQWIAAEYQKQGKRVLMLCYNVPLETWIKLNAEGYEVRSFFSLCRERILSSGQQFNVPADKAAENRFWEQDAPDRLFSILTETSAEEKYDVILVDEAQDFHKEWWYPIQLLLKDPDKGGLYMFRDPQQSGVYGHGTAYPSDGVYDVELNENCRNTKSINRYCSHVIHNEIASHKTAPIGVDPEINTCLPEVSARVRAVRKLVNQLLKEDIPPSQIAVLSQFNSKNNQSVLSQLRAVDNIPIRSDNGAMEAWLNGEAIWGSTTKRFKGLEAGCVIIADLIPTNDSFTDSDLYVACSRAKHKLFLFPATHEGTEYLRQNLTPQDKNTENR